MKHMILALAAVAAMAVPGLSSAAPNAAPSAACLTSAFFTHVKGDGYYANSNANCGIGFSGGNFKMDVYIKRNGSVQQHYWQYSNYGNAQLKAKVVPLYCGVRYQVVSTLTGVNNPSQTLVFSSGSPQVLCN